VAGVGVALFLFFIYFLYIFLLAKNGHRTSRYGPIGEIAILMTADGCGSHFSKNQLLRGTDNVHSLPQKGRVEIFLFSNF